jgi:hypothetical protein
VEQSHAIHRVEQKWKTGTVKINTHDQPLLEKVPVGGVVTADAF